MRLAKHTVHSVNIPMRSKPWRGPPDGSQLASAGREGIVVIWEATSGAILLKYQGHHRAAVKALSWPPDGRLLASASSDQTVHVWDPMTGTLQLRYEGHSATMQAVAWSPDGRTYSVRLPSFNDVIDKKTAI